MSGVEGVWGLLLQPYKYARVECTLISQTKH